jgi:hypothetical protein
MAILNCISCASTIKSLANIHNISTFAVTEFISSFNVHELDIVCEQQFVSRENFLYSKWIERIGYPTNLSETYWFHVTRLFSDNTISQCGILSLANMEDVLWAKLRFLCKASVSESEWNDFVIAAKSCNRYKSKQNVTSLGPFGFLIFEPIHLYRNKKLVNRDYSKGSELVDDICNGSDSHIGSLLWDLYLRETNPYIVKFSAPSSNYETPTAILYLWTKTWQPENIGSFAINTCFDGNGATIPAERVLAILPF